MNIPCLLKRIVFLLLVLGWVDSAGHAGLLEFAAQQGRRQYPNVSRQVLAFYYTWYGTPERAGRMIHWGSVRPESHEISQSTHYPEIGAYDSHDPALIDRHVTQAKQQGITGFIATWWGIGRFEDRAMPKLLDRAAAQDFSVAVYWETAPGRGQGQIEQARRDLLYLLRTYGSHTAYLKVDNKPVIFVYGRVMNQVPLSAWPEIVNSVRETYEGDFLLIADGYTASYARVFDGIHTYNICGWVQNYSPEELQVPARDSFTQAVALARQQGKISCLTIIPGYDDTKIRSPGIDAKRHDGQTYRVLWEEALRANPDWVLITSWNEWHEGSEIEPSWEDGDRCLKLTGQYTRRFFAQDRPARITTGGNRLPYAERVERIRDRLQRKTIGILPDFVNEAAFWVADNQLPFEELTWADLLDSTRFNARRLPIVLHAGSEHYVRTVQQDGDVDQALQRYLGEGGLLISVPGLPFPFYYDEQNRTRNAAHQFGFPLVGGGDPPAGSMVQGWETPASKVALSFRFNQQLLPQLPASVPYPTAGDLRWRPATRHRVAEGDVYISLAILQDALGNDYGDAMAYVEHRVSAPRGGKNLYACMHMPDVLGTDETMLTLLEFAAQRIAP